MTLSDAINGVEAAQNAFLNAASQTANDQLILLSAQAKIDAANAQISADQASQDTAGTAFNAALDALIAAAQGAKIITMTDPVPVPMPPVANVPPTMQGQ